MIRRLLALFETLLLAGCLAGAAHAQHLSWPQLPAEDAAPVRPSPPNVAEQQLPGGPRLVEASLGPSGLATVQIVISTTGGSPAAARVLAETLNGHVRIEGRVLSAAELTRRFARQGGEVDTQITSGALVSSVTVRKDRLAHVLPLMISRIRNREQPSTRELHRVLNTVRDQRADLSSTPQGALELAVEDATRLRTWPTLQSLKHLRAPELASGLAELLRPERVTLLVVGDIPRGAGLALLQRHTRDWRSTRKAVSPTPADGAATRAECFMVLTPPAAQTAVAVVAPMPVSAQEWHTARVAAAVLGAGGSARLNNELRVRLGLTYGAGARLLGPLDQLWLVAQALTRKDAAEQTGREMRKVVLTLSQPVESVELSNIKNLLVGSHEVQWTTTRTAANLISGAFVRGQSLTDLQSFPRRIQAVSDKDILEFARSTLQPQHLSSVFAGAADSTGHCQAPR